MNNQSESNTQNIVATTAKKPWYKKWWIWVIVAVVVIGGLGSSLSEKNSNKKDTPASSAVTKDKNTATETTKEETQTPTESPKALEKKFKNSCDTITYKKLARNPDKYKGNNFKITGQVIQVLDSDSWFDDSTTLRINITPEENEFADGGVLWSDTIISAVTIPDGEDRILEDDVITFWGTCEGAYTYESVLGSNVTVPRVDIQYYKIDNQ